MNERTIVAVYDTAAHAAGAVRALIGDNVPACAISQPVETASASGTGGAAPIVREKDFRDGRLDAGPERDTTVRGPSLDSGPTVVTVRAPDDHYDSVAAILERHNPVDLDARAGRYGSADTAAPRPNAAPAVPAVHASPPDGTATIQLVEETGSIEQAVAAAQVARPVAAQTPAAALPPSNRPIPQR